MRLGGAFLGLQGGSGRRSWWVRDAIHHYQFAPRQRAARQWGEIDPLARYSFVGASVAPRRWDLSSTDFGLYEGWATLVASGAVSFARASNAWAWDGDEIVTYDAGAPALTASGLILQDAAYTNRVPSNNFEGSSDYTIVGSGVDGVTGPDGTGSMTTVTATASGCRIAGGSGTNFFFSGGATNFLGVATKTAGSGLYLVLGGSTTAEGGVVINLASGAVEAAFGPSLTFSSTEVIDRGEWWDIATYFSATSSGVCRPRLALTTSAAIASWADAAAAEATSGEQMTVGWLQMMLNMSSRPEPIYTLSGSATRASDQLVLDIGDGSYDIAVRFGDGTSEQVLSAVEVSGGAGWTVPALNSPLITDIIVRAAA